MDNSPAIRSLIVTFLTEKLGISDSDTIEGDANLLVDGTLDSVSTMRLITHIEKNLEIKIPAKDLLPKNFMTLNAMVNYLGSKTEPTHPESP